MIVVGSARPVARKRHGCNACLGTIGEGDTYRRARVVDCGDAWTWKAHALCDTIVGLEGGHYCDEDWQHDPGEVAGSLERVFLGLLTALVGPVDLDVSPPPEWWPS